MERISYVREYYKPVTCTRAGQGEITEKKSRFIATVRPGRVRG